jgi:hypothetical protein
MLLHGWKRSTYLGTVHVRVCTVHSRMAHITGEEFASSRMRTTGSFCLVRVRFRNVLLLCFTNEFANGLSVLELQHFGKASTFVR